MTRFPHRNTRIYITQITPRPVSTHPLRPPPSLVIMLSPTDETIADIKSATAGFDLIFSNELEKAENLFGNGDSALHLLGSGACAFLQAALSLEVRARLCHTAVEATQHSTRLVLFRKPQVF